MKPINRIFAAAALMGVTLLTVNHATAQVVVKEAAVTNSAGTISEFGRDTIVIRSETSPEPLRYRYSKRTSCVDETGNPGAIETVKSGLPVTVYYEKDGDDLIANKVIVRRARTTTATE